MHAVNYVQYQDFRQFSSNMTQYVLYFYEHVYEQHASLHTSLATLLRDLVICSIME